MAEHRVDDVTSLLGLAVSSPDRALAEAGRVMAGCTDPWALSVARQARGLVLRDRGRTDLAVPELRRALRYAARATDPDREADVRATLGAALTMAGRTTDGLDQLGRAIAGARDPAIRAKVLMRRGYVLTVILARHREAARDLNRALTGVRRAGDPVWEARTLNLLGIAELARGRLATAEDLVTRAEAIFVREHQRLESVQTLHNRGVIAYCRGDLPTALALYDQAAQRYAECGVSPAELADDRCAALLTAGLVSDAIELADITLDQAPLQQTSRAELLLTLATVELAGGHADTALVRAREARGLFRRQRRDAWALRAELVELRAQQQTGRITRGLVAAATEVARRLEAEHAREASLAWLLAGRVATELGLGNASALLGAAASYRHHPAGLVSTSGWLARAIDRDARGESRGVLAACRRGLDALDEYRTTLGSSELRALATIHGEELAALGLRHAVHSSPRTLLRWAERWRANTQPQPTVAPARERETADVLAALRASDRRLSAAHAAGEPTRDLERARLELEQQVRRTGHRLAGSRVAPDRFAVDRLVAAVGDGSFIELVEAGGRLQALVIAAGIVRRFELGTVDDAERAVDLARFALRQAARGRPVALEPVGDQLGTAVLGEALRACPDGPLVISPTSRLHAAPWGLVPALADVPLTVTPSAAAWLRSRSAPRGAGRRVLILGPDLKSGAAEVEVLAARDPDAVVLRDGAAVVDACLAALDGAGIAHVAAHGRFRQDSPMFSALEVDDGPLTVHDLQRLHRAPRRLVLSACESGVMSPVGTSELLGFAAAMLSLGSVGIVCSVVPVNDQATVPLMVEMHAGLEEADELGVAMLRARRAGRGDPALTAAAAAFLAIGA
ncbi:Tetratricopeptide TPR_4 [Kribbella flavida DSM 17836]|uniref:Tetratricopeptide TPR_4 n=1 Tax=Kribbella flavida (strain DSM 17836 / JCM 10339 / NBRC 14399) TaxID=479435 RepID=D2PTU7_KRIFD|nr:CHAT domain-containing tetratricopeptide repeat protein [Kribbella flavida]ADB33230.1 Tetratricopeptide TPR_4 [Kribbella flavida DSM 17836]